MNKTVKIFEQSFKISVEYNEKGYNFEPTEIPKNDFIKYHRFDNDYQLNKNIKLCIYDFWSNYNNNKTVIYDIEDMKIIEVDGIKNDPIYLTEKE